MSMDVSRLGIVVESQGINEARDALIAKNGKGGLFGAADKTERAVTKLTDSLDKLMKVSTSGTAAAWNSSFSQLNGTVIALNSQLSTMAKTLANMGNAQVNVTAKVNQTTEALNRKSAAASVVANTIKAMITAGTVYGAINMGATLAKQADAWQLMEAKLKNATGSMYNARVAQGQLYDLAQKLRVPLEDAARLYYRLAPAVQKAGKSSEYAMEMVEGINTALQLSGATGGEAASVMLQLSQSFSSGVLNGQEFNAVAENGSVIMRALEKYTGKTTYELKKLGSEGKLSMDVVGKAIQAALPEWRKQFETLPVTFDGAMQRLKNAWLKAIGEMGQDTGFNKQLSSAIRDVEEMLPGLAKELGKAFIGVATWLKDNKETLGEIWDQVKGITGDLMNMVKMFGNLLGMVVGARDEFSAVGLIIFSWRLALNASIDIVKAFGSSLVNTGLTFTRALIIPAQILLAVISSIASAWTKSFEVLGGAAKLVGLTKLSEGLESLSNSVRGFADNTMNFNGSITKFFEAGHKAANSWVKDLKEGNGELDKMLRNEQLEEAGKKAVGSMDEKAWGANPNPKARVDEKALKAAQTELKRYAKAMEDLTADATKLNTLLNNLQKDGLNFDKVGPEQKKFIDAQEHLNTLIRDGANFETIWHQIMIVNAAKRNAAIETQIEHTKEYLQVQKAVEEAEKNKTKTVMEEALASERKLATYGMEKGAIEALELAEARRTEMALLSSGELSDHEQTILKTLQERIVWMQRLQAAQEGIGQLDAQKEFDKLFDPKRAERFGNVLADGFGHAADAAGKLINSLQKYEARMSVIDKARKKAEKETDPVRRAAMNQKIIEEQTEAQIASYADMAGAAKGFFKENTAGYRALEGAEKAFRLFQMAMQLKSFLQEIGLIQASTAATLAGNSAKMASDTAAAATGVASATAQGTALAAAGVANQSLGDPYSAFARMAAMAALMAALGFAVSGGSSKSVSKARQEAQGTGTVFGDASAKSESISKSIEILAKNSDIALRYSSGMLHSLQSIEQSLTGAVSGVIRSGGVTGKGFSNSSGLTLFGAADPLTNVLSKLPVVGKFISSLFGSSKTLLDSGLMGSNQSVANILQSGFNVKGYQDVQTKKKAFGFTYSDKTKTTTSAVDPAISREFGNVVNGMVDSLTSAAQVLGFSGDEIRKKLEAVNIDIGKISLKDLSSEEVQKQLEAVFSAIGDKLATVALPSALAFQKAGEGLLETAVRVASGVETANYELEKLGVNAVNYADLTNKNGDVGAEIVRQSILAIEQGSGIGEIISTLSGEAGDIAGTYKSLLGVRSALQGLGIASDVSRDLIRAAGGLDAMQDALEAYTTNFFSESEQNAMKLSALRKEFDKIGVAMPTSKAAFRALVEQLSASGASGQALAVKVIGLADAFANLSDSTDTLIEDARGRLQEAYDAEAQSLNDVIDKMGGFSDSLKEFKTSLLTGDLSTLDVAGKYGVEKANFESVLAAALGGDENAIAKYQEAAQSFLEASRAMNASGGQYTADFERVLAQTDFVQKLTQDQKTAAEKQLEALNKQVEGLLKIDESVLTVAQAIQQLNDLIAKGVTIGTLEDSKATIMPVDAPSATTAATNNTAATDSAALIAQVKALTAEVATLRREQTEQTALLASATHEAADANAQKVVAGQSEAISSARYGERVQAALT